MSRRLEGTGVTANLLHPGVIATEFGADGDLRGINALMFRMMKWFLPGPEAGAQTSIFLASAPELEKVTGRYFDNCREKTPSRLTQNEEVAERLWAATGRLIDSS